MRNKINLNDFSKWLQYNRVKNLRGSEYFPYPLYMYTHIFFMCYYISFSDCELRSVYLGHGIINLLQLLIMVSWVSERLHHNLFNLREELRGKTWQDSKQCMKPANDDRIYILVELLHCLTISPTFRTVSNMGMRTNLIKPIWAVGLVTLSRSMKGATGSPSNFSLSLWTKTRQSKQSQLSL